MDLAEAVHSRRWWALEQAEGRLGDITPDTTPLIAEIADSDDPFVGKWKYNRG